MPKIENAEVFGLERVFKTAKYPKSVDISTLNNTLTPGIRQCLTCKTGEGHDNALNGIIVQFDLTFSNKAWVEAERYHFLDFVSSQSTMHRITKFDLRRHCNRYVDERVISICQDKIEEYKELLETEDKDALDEKYLEVLYNIPSGFELTAGMTTNYRQLKTIYQQRRHHRLPDWKMFCDWVKTLPYAELITGGAE